MNKHAITIWSSIILSIVSVCYYSLDEPLRATNISIARDKSSLSASSLEPIAPISAPTNLSSIKDALARFERSLLTPNSPFDRYLLGDLHAIEEEEKEGDRLFKTYGCVSCHQGQEFDRYRFKVPSLRNIALTALYFRNGSAPTLEEAVEVMAKYQLGQQIPQEDTERIVQFLRTLTGEYEGVPLK
jgi:cytochrome c peroxidase